MRRLFALVALLAGCTPDFDNETTVQDLRVLGVSAEPPEVLLDGGPISMQPELCPTADILQALATELAMHVPPTLPTMTLRPLVVDPQGGGRPVHYRAVACVSPTGGIDEQGGGGNMMPGGVRQTIGRGACPDDAPVLGEGDVSPAPGSLSPKIEVPLPLTPNLLVGALQQDPLGLVYGLALTAQVTVSAGDQQVVTRKRVLVTARLTPDQVPNQNPVIPAVSYRKTEDDPLIPYDPAQPPQVKLGEKLRLEPTAGEKQMYPTRLGDRHTGCVHTQMVSEALRFAFFASAGTFSPDTTNTEPPVFRDPGPDVHRLESVYEAPKELLPGQSDVVHVWIVTRDERVGSSFAELTLRLIP
ncbi:MAG TPA: hypothetical protein VN914_19280 [Polyangia bacterium]|nr:hypothetical protein [Polyangia bacterium]